MKPILVQQEIPFDHPESSNWFTPSSEKPFVATPAVLQVYQRQTIVQCLEVLQQQAGQYQGIDRLQIFKSPEPGKPDLWLIDDGGETGPITALLPSDY